MPDLELQGHARPVSSSQGKEPQVPHTMQLIILPALPPEGEDQQVKYRHIFKDIYLHRNMIVDKEVIDMCYGISIYFEWKNHIRQTLTVLIYMMDRMGGKQIRNWVIQSKLEKKVIIDQNIRDAGYHFIRENGPRTNNTNQFMEWTTIQIRPSGRSRTGKKARSSPFCKTICEDDKMPRAWNTGLSY